MPHHHHRPRRASSSGSSSDSSSSWPSSSAASSSSDSDSRRRHPSKRKHGRHEEKDSGSDSSSSDSSSTSDDSDDGSLRHHRHHHHHGGAIHLDKKEKRRAVWAGCALLACCIGVAIYYSMDDSASTSSGTSGGSIAGAGGGGSTTSKASSSSARGTTPKKSSTAVASVRPSFCPQFVNYLNADDAKTANLISTTSSTAIMRVDNTTALDSGANRDSVRISSKAAVPIESIIIGDFERMPWGCATWPAFWTLGGGTWPDEGEIDILEGVNVDDTNQYTLHVKDSNCKQSTSVDITGTAVEANNNCDGNADGNTGCSYAEVAENSYGEGFNGAGGGVFVTLFSAASISVWFWSRADIPDDITSGSPDSANWGKPSALWPKDSCDIASYFGDQTIVFDTTLCGDWAGSSGVWSADSTCSAAASTCSDYVKDAANFNEAWWVVNYVKVYAIGS
ncbi:hypothetical protein JCM8547_009296 [Rhodosporidiobolus lusitaniae]